MNALGGLERVRSGKLLYTDEIGHDACGIGGIAARDGTPSHEILQRSVSALICMEHRGGVCGEAGDGAGITTTIPHAFLKEEVKRLKLNGGHTLKADENLAVGVVFHFGPEAERVDRVRTVIQETLANGPIRFLGFRPVPVNVDALPDRSRLTMPVAIEQVLFQATGSNEQNERWLYHRRLELRAKFQAEGLKAYLPSLSTKLISYKGLVTSPQLADYYADLSNPAYEAGIAYFHRRYSTNTFPNWTLAQPFRMTCHNGEINTIRTTRNAVSAFARGLRPMLPGSDLLTPKMSDSGSFDEWVEYLMLEGQWSLLRALRLSVPPVWDTEADVWGSEAFDLFTYYRRTFGGLAAWDGPAGIIGTDGRILAGLVDRMGLRPVRWCSDRRGWLYIGSESGVFGLDNTTIVASGQLQPGQMIAIDTATGERLDSYQIMGRVVKEAQAELGDIHDLNRRQIIVPEGFDFTRQTDDTVGAMLAERKWALDHLLQAAGWDFERAVFVKEMAKLKKEPLSSMGHDRVLTVFSQHHPTLFKYLQQTFAEVTNPPIDPYREGGAMSLTTYLGRSRLFGRSNEGVQPSSSAELPIRQMELPSPVIPDAIIEEIRQNELLGFKMLDATFPLSGGAEALRKSLAALQSSAEKAIHEGYHVLCVSDREACRRGIFPIPSLLALGAVHQYLCRQGLRENCSLLVQAGDIQEGHDVCCLVAFGADAVHPYLMLRLVKDGLVFKDPDSKQENRLEAREALENLFAALEDTIKKVISKMGITTIEGYRGAQLFEAVGFGHELMEFLGDFPSRLGGIGLNELVEDAEWRVQRAEKIKDGVLGGNKDYRAFHPQVRMALRDAVKQSHPEPEQDGGEMAYIAPPAEEDPGASQRVADKYVKFTDLVNKRVPTVLRDLFDIKLGGSVPSSEMQPAIEIVRKHFRGAAMSHGALTGASHMTIAAAVNELDTLSNSGEGGEARWRNDIPERAWGPFWEKIKLQRTEHPDWYTLGGTISKSRFRSRIRQVASGRFGVDAEYLVNADEISIKMAQGAKPGEGGQLMGKKVTAEIAEIRFAKPGTDLISPPPHHDIYSIEDLAQLIYDLKAVKPEVPVSVKLVAVENIGTIAVGVAKAGADIIEIDGIDGGTGAAMVSSKEHAGLPSEMGLAEAHQALVVNGMRKAVKLRVGGGIKNGYDVIKYTLLGADEFSFGQGLMVSVGCIVCKSCHIPNCPTGITGSPEIFKGHPEHTKAYLMAVAEEVRHLLGQMGFRQLSEIAGRSELLLPRTDLQAKHPRAAMLSLARFIQPDMAISRLSENYSQETSRGVCSNEPSSLNQKIMAAVYDAVDTAQNSDLVFRIRNSDRSVGATVAGMIARLYGREGLPNLRKIKVRFDGEAGQSFGAWCVNGLDLELRGFAQDGVAKGISGGTVTVTLDYTASDYGGELQSVAGNNVGYGATGGTIFIGGRAGHRLGIRNSGATIVAEAAGKYACEYMTRGRVLILGPVENEIGSGMTGGELVIFDPATAVPAKLHGKSVTVIDCSHVDYEWLHPLIHQYHARTGSRQAEHILKNWGEIRRGRRLRKILPLAVARAMEDLKTAGTNAG